MRPTSLLAMLLGAFAITACNPFYSVEQSTVERGYRWISRGEYTRAISTFEFALRDYPGSGLAHLGLADAYAEARRDREAIDTYTKAMSLLKADDHAMPLNATGNARTIGARPLSYQNQGLRFPHGVEAYVYFRRALASEALAKADPSRRREHLDAAKADYVSARSLAPNWKDPEARLACLADPLSAGCNS